MTSRQDPRARARRAPFRIYLVELALCAPDGTVYSALRMERAQDADDASGQALHKEHARQSGVAAAGGMAHEVRSVLGVRKERA